MSKLLYLPNQLQNPGSLIYASPDINSKNLLTLNREHTFANSIVAFFMASPTFVWRELVSNNPSRQSTAPGTCSVRPTWIGSGLRRFIQCAQNTDHTWAVHTGNGGQTPESCDITLMAEFYTTLSSSGVKCIVSLASQGTADSQGTLRCSVNVSDGTTVNSIRGYVDGATDGSISSSASTVAINTTYVVWFQYSSSWSPLYPRIWLNGVEYTTTQVATITPNTNVMNSITIGSNSGTAELDGGVSWAGYWKRILSESEMWAISLNPNALLAGN